MKPTYKELVKEVEILHFEIAKLKQGSLKKIDYAGNKDHSLGMGSLDLTGQHLVTARYRLAYLETAIKSLKTIGVEYVDVVYKEKYPLLLGNINKQQTKAHGVFIAPVLK